MRNQLKQGRIDAAVQLTAIAVPVKAEGLQRALAGALDGMIADGSYAKLLTRWQLDGMGVASATVNAGK